MSQAVETILAHTERSIQDALFFNCTRKHHRLMVPNVQVFGWESDFVSVTANDFLCEYEIKISRADFRKDLIKNRHQRLTNVRLSRLQPQPGWWQNENKLGAVYLYYVVPADLVTVDEVPEHAGLMAVDKVMRWRLSIVKKAPRLHTNKITERQRAWLERSLTTRYWHARVKP